MQNIKSFKTSKKNDLTLNKISNKKNKKLTKNSVYLKRKKELLTYLVQEKDLTEKEKGVILWYRKFHFKAKRDIGGPQHRVSPMAYFEKNFNAPPYDEEKINKQDTQDLQRFRQIRKTLLGQQRQTVLFIEALFEYPQNDLEFFESWRKEDQNACTKGFKCLAQYLLRVSLLF